MNEGRRPNDRNIQEFQTEDSRSSDHTHCDGPVRPLVRSGDRGVSPGTAQVTSTVNLFFFFTSQLAMDA